MNSSKVNKAQQT